MWLCMIFTVWPMRMGLLGLRQGVWGEQRIISVGCLENNKALEARERVSTWLDHRDPQDGRNGFVRLENVQCGLEVQGSASADLRQKAFCWFVVAEGALPAMMVALRRVFDRFSSVPRSTFVALSFVFRLFLVRSSIGLR